MVLSPKGQDLLTPGLNIREHSLITPDVKRTLTNINSSILSFSRIAKANGREPSEYILEQFNRLSGNNAQSLTGFPAEMKAATEAAERDAAAEAEAIAKKNKPRRK